MMQQRIVLSPCHAHTLTNTLPVVPTCVAGLARCRHMISAPGQVCPWRAAGKGAVYTYDAVGSHERVGFSCQVLALHVCSERGLSDTRCRAAA